MPKSPLLAGGFPGKQALCVMVLRAHCKEMKHKTWARHLSVVVFLPVMHGWLNVKNTGNPAHVSDSNTRNVKIVWVCSQQKLPIWELFYWAFLVNFAYQATPQEFLGGRASLAMTNWASPLAHLSWRAKR